jgi:hypothetical protein
MPPFCFVPVLVIHLERSGALSLQTLGQYKV